MRQASNEQYGSRDRDLLGNCYAVRPRLDNIRVQKSDTDRDGDEGPPVGPESQRAQAKDL
jgi:hypothetical protein